MLYITELNWVESGEKLNETETHTQREAQSAHNVFFSYSSIVFHCHYLLMCVSTYIFVTNFLLLLPLYVCVCVRAFCFVSFHFVIFLFFRSSENRISNNDPFVQIHRKLTQLHTFNNTAHTMRRECIGSHLSDAWMVMRMAQSLSLSIYILPEPSFEWKSGNKHNISN